MRIAVVTPWFPSAENPTLGQFVDKEVKALRQAGHDVRVVFLDRGASEVDRRVSGGIPVLVLPVDVRNPAHGARFAKVLRESLSFADVVHSHAISVLPILAATSPGRKWVHSEHWSALTTPETVGPLGQYMVGAASWLLKLPDVVVGESGRLVKALEKNRIPESVELVPCVVPAPARLKEAPRGDVLRLASTGGLIDRKDPVLAVKVLKVLKDQGIAASLRWVGEGPLRGEVESLAAKLDVDAEFVGTLSPTGVQDEIAACDIFFAPTKGENFFVAAAEALVNGRPLCAGVNGGHVEYASPEYSEIVSEQTPEAYAKAIIRLRDKTAGVSAAEIADSVRERFSPEAVAAMLGEIYEEVAKPRVLVATRIHLPEPAAASLRWDVIEKALVGAGFEVEVLTSKYSGSQQVESATQASNDATIADPKGVKVKRWPVLRDKEGNLRGYVPYLSFDIPLLGRLLAAKRPDVVMVEPPPTTGVVARIGCGLRGIPYIWYAADTWTSGTRSMGAPSLVVAAVEWMEKTAIRGAQAVIAVTSGVQAGVQNMGAVAVARIPNGIDVETYQIARSDDAPFSRFAYTGTASEFQGAVILMDAFEQLLRTDPNVQLYFVGSGSDWEELQERAEFINAAFDDGVPRVVVEGQKTPAEVAELLNTSVAALVSISPAHAGDTPYPTKILAALATGTPVIYAGPGEAIEDIEESDLGWVTDYDANQIAEAMRLALEEEGDSSGRLRQWVIDHRSTKMMGQMVVETVKRVLD